MARVRTNGIELEVELHGSEAGRPLVLVCGLGRQLVCWTPEFLRQLADAGHRVVVFDNRDVGLSTHLEGARTPHPLDVRAAVVEGRDPGVPYLLTDMAEDLIGLLDVLELPSAHVAGTSMGAMIAQEAALRAPERFDSLISIMSTTGEPGLPPPTPEAAALLMRPAPSEREAYVAHQVENERVLNGPGYPLDEKEARARWERAFERLIDRRGVARQLAAVTASPPRHQRLRAMRVPTLVIHGEADPLIPVDCGRATAAAIPGAKLLVIPGMGHCIPAGACPQVVAAIEAHTRAHEVGGRAASV